MIVLYTTERNYPWGALRSTNASKVKVILEDKGLQYRIAYRKDNRAVRRNRGY